MTDGEPSKVKLETWLLVGFIVALLLSTTVIVVTSADKDTVYSAYVTDADTNLQYQQISTMRASLGDEGKNYVVANTMSTPMLVNDWREPHRTLQSTHLFSATLTGRIIGGILTYAPT